MRSVSPDELVRFLGMPALTYCERVDVSPLRARSKRRAARSRAAGGRSEVDRAWVVLVRRHRCRLRQCLLLGRLAGRRILRRMASLRHAGLCAGIGRKVKMANVMRVNWY